MDFSIDYLAGFFDGDGSISLLNSYSKVLVRVSQVVEEPLQRYVIRYGGTIRIGQITTGGLPYYEYATKNRVRCGHILTELYPHLVVKQAKAQVALERLGLSVPKQQETVSIEYLAGFFDAEGSVCTLLRGKNEVSLKISVGQNVELPLLMFQEMFGGYVIKCNTLTQAGNETFKWSLKHSDVIQFCDEMISRVLVKRQQLMLAKRISMIRLCNSGCDPRVEEKLNLSNDLYKLNRKDHLRIA